MSEVYWEVSTAGSPHAIILGMSGQGKSRTIKKLLREFADQAKVLVLDFHGDLSENLDNSIKVIDVREAGLPFNPFQPSKRDEDSVTQFCLDMADIFQVVCGLGAMQRVQVYKALVGAFESARYSQDDAAKPPTIRDFVSQLKILEESNRGVHSSDRLLSITEFQIFKANVDEGIENLSTSIILDLSKLQSETLKLVCASLMLRKLYSSMQHRGKRSAVDYGVFVDEAHLLSKDPTISKLFKESRKFGISMVLASQSITDFHSDVLENTGLKMIFRLNHPASATAANFLGGAGARENKMLIEALVVGECAASTQASNEVKKIRVFR